ncbi:MAG: 4-hydroxy-tetrahydrodipicolinate synthase [Epulopiscium sp.]|nr:4-hydroxy-tetrahydrodipicolinate synthase [Candidatus Epulonipiscium sp.]
MTLFTGSGVAIVTPFNEEGVDFETLGKLIEFHIENGTDSIIFCGTTGEASTMTDEEQLECIRFGIHQVNKRVPVIAGAGSNDTVHGAYLTREAMKLGADGVLLVTPYYNKTTQKGLIEHYTYIAQSADIPIILYNVPGRTGLNMLPKTVYELSKVDNIVAVKEASGNISLVTELMHLCHGRLDLYSGNDDQILPLLSLGAKGVISVIANILPQDTHELTQAFFDGNLQRSLELQLKMQPLVSALFSEVSPIPVKAALSMMGYNVGQCRRPLTTMEDANEQKLKQAMIEYGISLQ